MTGNINEDWMSEQLRHFQPSDMDTFVRMLRAYERADRQRLAEVKTSAA